ncbi:MAG: SCP2 sterol-binding domain-containing protein, partial [Bdellovibrionota bacterium]
NSFLPQVIASKLPDVRFVELRDSVQIDIEGAGTWTARIQGGKPLVASGPADNPLLTLALSAKAIEAGLGRSGVAGIDLDATDVSAPARAIAEALTQELADSVREQVRGTIKFALARGDGMEEALFLGFSSVDPGAPTCTIQTTEDEFREMIELGLTPQQAFMAGKIRLEGDMSIAMTLAMIAMPLLEPGMKFLTGRMKGRG